MTPPCGSDLGLGGRTEGHLHGHDNVLGHTGPCAQKGPLLVLGFRLCGRHPEILKKVWMKGPVEGTETTSELEAARAMMQPGLRGAQGRVC